MQVQSAGLQLPSRYKLWPCYGHDNRLCGCYKPLTRGPTSRKQRVAGTVLHLPQCTAHGVDAEQGTSELMSAVASNVQEPDSMLRIVQLPVSLPQQRIAKGRVGQHAKRSQLTASGAFKSKGASNESANCGHGGRWGNGRAGKHYVDVVFVKDCKAAGAELNDQRHSSVPAQRVDALRKQAAKHSGLSKLQQIKVTGAQWQAEARKLVAKLTR